MVAEEKSDINALLADSFKKLAVKKSIEKITIKEITDGAGVIRPTFYNHFQDKYELLEWIVETELITPMEPDIDRGLLKEAVTASLQTMAEERDFYIRAVRLEGQNSFKETLVKKVTELILKKLDIDKLRNKQIYPWLNSRRIARFFANTFCYAVIEWAEEGMEIPIEDIVDVFVFLTANSTVDMIEMLD